MRHEQEDYISENVLLLFPFVKRLLRGDAGDPALAPFRNHSYQVLRVLEKNGPLPISEIGKRLFIAKQNMTPLTDKLMQDGLVERKSSLDDRRVINIVVTEKGIEALKATTLALKSIIKKNLSSLDDGDIDALCAAVQTTLIVSSKIETGDCHA